jgi:division protein 1
MYLHGGGGGISANVTKGKNIDEKKREKGKILKEKEERGKEKEERGKEKEERGKKKEEKGKMGS